jgi:hypothetical protein
VGVGLWVGARARHKFLGVISREFGDFCIMRLHRSQVHQSQPKKRWDQYHMTQLHTRVSRADHKGGTGGSGDQKRTTKEGQQRQQRVGTRK